MNGDTHDDFILGGVDDDFLAGGEVDAFFSHRYGNDHIDGYDTIEGDRLNEDATPLDGNNSLWVCNGDELIYGRGGDDELGGNSSADTLVGGSGEDWMAVTTATP